MTALPFMRWYPADYAGDTTHLTRDQDGGYRLLLDSMWLHDGKLPDDDAQLAVITKCATKKEWQNLRKILSPFFSISRGFWRHKRLTFERIQIKELQQARVIAGKKGAAQRWQTHDLANGKAHGKTMANAPPLLPLPPQTPLSSSSPPYPDVSPPLYPPPSQRRGGGRAGRSHKKSPRTVQTEAFYHAAIERHRDC